MCWLLGFLGKLFQFRRFASSYCTVSNKTHKAFTQNNFHKCNQYRYLKNLATNERTNVLLAKSLLIPHIDYFSDVYNYGLNAQSFNVLNKAFKAILGCIYNIKRYNSPGLYVNRFLRCSFKSFIKYRTISIEKSVRTMQL